MKHQGFFLDIIHTKVYTATQTHNYNMTNLRALFITIHTICFIINIPSLIWHIRNKSIPAMTLLLYIEVMMIDGFVSAIAWGGENYLTSWDGKGWCDIMVRFHFAVAVGISSSISCVSFNLLIIFLTNKLTTFWFSNKWVKPACEIFFSIIFPFFISGISYFAQSERYMLSRYSGCYAPLASESISILVFYLWIFFWSLVGMVICTATLVLYYKRRKAAKDILLCTNSGLSVKRFMRLLIFCVLVICSSIIFSGIIGSQLIITNVFFDKSVLTRKTWHYIFRLTHVSALDVNKWVLISISFVSFFIFGVGEDAKKMYISIIKKLPFGDAIIEKFSSFNLGFKHRFGGDLMNNKKKFILRFWDSGDDDDDYTIDKRSDHDSDENSFNGRSDIEMDGYSSRYGYNPTDDEAHLDNLSIDKYENLGRERIQDLGSLATPATVVTSDTLMKYYNDENLKYQLEEAKREVDEEEGRERKMQGHSGQAEEDDELKYLYY